MRIRALILGISLLIAAPTYSQIKDELIWTSTLEDNSEEEYRKNYLRLAKGGYRLDLGDLSVGKVTIHFTSLPTITSSIPGAGDGLAFNYQNKNGQLRELFIQRNQIRTQLREQFEIYLDEKMSTMRIRGSADKYRKNQVKDFELVLKGKKKGVKWRDYTWPIEIGLVDDIDPAKPYTISFVCQKVPYAKLKFDSLYSDLAQSLPQLDNEACEPFDRYSYYRKYFGMSYQGFRYRPYRPRAGIPRKKNFRIYFDQASSSYQRKEVNAILKYLNDSNLVIQTAKVMAFASVEGDSAINMRLQQQRAEVLMNTLEKANNDSIEISIETREDWGLFRSQISKTPYRNRYDREDWKRLLVNDSIRSKLEKFLKQQRRAELFLTLTQRLTEEEKVTVALGDFQRYVRRYKPTAPPDRRIQQVRRIYAIKKYLEIQGERGVAEPAQACDLFPLSANEYHIVQFYETAKKVRAGKTPACQNYKDIILAAHFAVMNLIEKYGDKRLYLKEALDIQSFTYEMVGKNEVGSEILCQMIYPDEPPYYNLTLNQLYFQNHQGFEISQNLPCLGSYLDQKAITDRFYASTSSRLSTAAEPDPQYYYVLKKIVLEDDKAIQKLVQRSDHIVQFDIFEFLYYNISNWNVFDNQFYDPEVTPEIMAKEMDRLISMKAVICPNQISTLALQFYLKVMHYSLVEEKADELTDEAIDFVSHYYQAHAAKVTDGLALAVAKQIMALTPLYYYNEPSKEAYDVLRLKDWKEPLKGEALNYYLNLVNLVAQDRDQRMKILERKYPNKVWDSFFSGKYSIPQESKPK